MDEWFCPECAAPGVAPTHGNVLSFIWVSLIVSFREGPWRKSGLVIRRTSIRERAFCGPVGRSFGGHGRLSFYFIFYWFCGGLFGVFFVCFVVFSLFFQSIVCLFVCFVVVIWFSFVLRQSLSV